MVGPNWGKDVFIPLDWIIGGAAEAGNGWKMLMECLAAGRSISLPALSTGGGKLVSQAAGAYARVRRQFKLPIGKFEGVEEALARIAGHTYLMDAARTLTCGAVDQGERPSVISAIVKYQCTERMRTDPQRRHGHRGRQRHLPGPAQPVRPHLPGPAHQHHGGRRQHPHPHPDHLRPGRHPLPSLRPERDAGHGRPRPAPGPAWTSTGTSAPTSPSACPPRPGPCSTG